MRSYARWATLSACRPAPSRVARLSPFPLTAPRRSRVRGAAPLHATAVSCSLMSAFPLAPDPPPGRPTWVAFRGTPLGGFPRLLSPPASSPSATGTATGTAQCRSSACCFSAGDVVFMTTPIRPLCPSLCVFVCMSRVRAATSSLRFACRARPRSRAPRLCFLLPASVSLSCRPSPSLSNSSSHSHRLRTPLCLILRYIERFCLKVTVSLPCVVLCSE